MDNTASYGHPGGVQGYKITSKAVPCGSPAVTQTKNHSPAKVSDTRDISNSYKQKRYLQTTPHHNEDSVKEIRGSCKRAKGAAREPKVFVKNSERLTVWARTGRPPHAQRRATPTPPQQPPSASATHAHRAHAHAHIMRAYARAHTHTCAPVTTITTTHAHARARPYAQQPYILCVKNVPYAHKPCDSKVCVILRDNKRGKRRKDKGLWNAPEGP